MELGNGGVPEELRCHRTDGRRWRCNRPAVEGKKLCDIHHQQGRHRQYKTKVPESLKIQRKKKFKGPGSRNDDSAPPKKTRKKGKLELELLRMVLKREVEKKSTKRKVKETKCGVFEEEDEEEEEELTRDLPNGLMAISPPPPCLNKLNHLSNVASCSSFGYSPCEIKVGVETNVGGSGSGSGTRSFRSKNIEPLPVGKLQAVPFKKDVMRMKRKNRICHWCRRRDLAGLIRCSSCRKEFFCPDCIKDQYFDKHEEVKMACPVCRATCCCKMCLEVHCRDIESKGGADEKNKVDKVLNFHYLICVLLPVLKQISEDHSTELEIEANIKGQKPSDVEIREPEASCSKQYCCNNCKTSIADLHRSCPNCSYSLCLSCCRDILHGRSLKSLPSKSCNGRVARRPVSTSKWIYGHRSLDPSILMPKLKGQNGGITCPPSEYGGCGNGFFDLTCIFPCGWIKELEVSAEEVVGCYDLPEAVDVSSSCSICLEINHATKGILQLREAARREDSHDNHLFCPTTLELRNDNLDHFQKHWGKGQPVIVRNVLKASDQSWDPIAMFCTYLKNNIAKSDNEKNANCLDWFEVEIGFKQLFMGSFKGPSNSFWNEKLMLRGWLSSHLFQEHFPAHYAEILRSLPLPEYMDPISGILNIASEMPPETTKPDLGPFVYISYGSGEGPGQSDNMSKLRYDSYDGVNILVHTSNVPVSTEQLNYISKLMKKHKEKNACEEDLGDREQVEDMELDDMIRKEVQLHRKVARVSWFAAATCVPDAADFGDQETSHERVHDSLTDSDTDTDTDTEVSKFFFGPLKTSRKSVNHKYCGTNGKSASHVLQEEVAESFGAQWDVFRREDVPKLVKYLNRHSHEFSRTSGLRQANPILDQNFFLDSVQKRRLKEEFGIEPWTFEQHVGEAVIIPAGCPYQIRNLQSCVSVVLDFMSPENVTECIQLVGELRLLPDNHKAKVDSLEVKKMAVHSISRAVKEIRELTQADSIS